MIQTSEYCTVGHPDRTCDYIASTLLDRYLESDRSSRVALEVQLKDTFCTVSGEVTSKRRFSNREMEDIVRDAICRVGYTDEYRDRFGASNAISGNDVTLDFHLSQQSGDIAQGVDADGWGDQGIFFGLAVDDAETGNMPKDYWLARRIGHELNNRAIGGLDVKTQVTVEDEKPIECVIAVPLLPDESADKVESLAKDFVGDQCKIIINGTGRYVKHGSIGDCGTTGRKLVVDFYGGNSRIGGGSPWGKDPTKADVSLNVYARIKALEYRKAHHLSLVQCQISCCIGRKEIRISYFDAENNLLHTETEAKPAHAIINELGLFYPCYAGRCATGLFGYESTEKM